MQYMILYAYKILIIMEFKGRQYGSMCFGGFLGEIQIESIGCVVHIGLFKQKKINNY